RVPSPAPHTELQLELAPVPPTRRKKEQKTPELVLEDPSPSTTVETPMQLLEPVKFVPEPSPVAAEESTVDQAQLLAQEPMQLVPGPSPLVDEPTATIIQAPIQTLAPAFFEPESSPVDEPIVAQETVVLSESAIESAFCATDEEDPSRIEEASEAEIMLKRPAEHRVTTVAIGVDDFAHTAFTPTTLWNSAVFCDPFGELPAHFNVTEDEPRSALLPGKISFRGQEIGVRVEDIEKETAEVNEQGTMERMMKKCKQATLDFDVPLAAKKLFSKSPTSTLEKEKKKLLEVDGVDSGLEKSPEMKDLEPPKDKMDASEIYNDEFVLIEKIGTELLEEKDLDSIIDEESEAARIVGGAYAEAPERVSEASVAVILQRRNTAEETQLNMELQRRRSEIPIQTESEDNTSLACSPPAKPRRGMERRPTIESDTPLVPSDIVEDPSPTAAVVNPLLSVQHQLVVADIHNVAIEEEENKRASFTDDEGLLRPATLHDLGGESSDSSFHATESRTLPKEDSAKIRQQISKMKEVERIAKRVEAELSALNAASNSKSIEVDDDVKHIEEAIISISDQLALAHPVSEAQAEASEELLRTTLAAMILNPDVDPNEDAESLKKPIQMLRRKLSEIENSLMEDVEVEEVLSHQEPADATPPGEYNAPGGESERSTPAPKKTMKKVPSMEYLRVTPLTTNIKEQLITLENMIEEASDYADKEDSSDERPLLDKTPSPSGTGRRMAMPKRKELHDLFVQINNEINTIRAYCKKKLPKQGTDAVMNVLGKVKTHVTTIVNIMQVAKKKAAHAAAKSPSRLGKTYKKLRNEKEKQAMTSSTSEAEEFMDLKEFSSDASTMSKSLTVDDKEATPVPPPRRSRTASADPGPTAPPRTRRQEVSVDGTRQKSSTLQRPTRADIETAIKKAFTLPASLRKEKKPSLDTEEEAEIQENVQNVVEAAPHSPKAVKNLSRSDSTQDDHSKNSRKVSSSELKEDKILSKSDTAQSGPLKISSHKGSIEERTKASESASIPEPEEKVEEPEPVSIYESEPASDKLSEKVAAERKLSRSDTGQSDSAKEDSSRISSRQDSRAERKDDKMLTRSDSAGSAKMSKSSVDDTREKSPALKNFVPFHRRGKEEARKASLASHFDELSSLCLENTTSTPERESVLIDRLEQAEKEEKDAIEAIMRELAAENIYSGGGDSPSGDTPIDEILAREEVRADCATPAENVSVDCRIEVEEDNWRADSVVLPESMERSVDTVASTDVESSTIRRTATTMTFIAVCQMEAAMATNGEKEALAIEVPLSEIVKTRTLLLEDVDSVQMLCEESDFGTDTETSCLLRGTARSYPRPSSLLGLQAAAKAFKTLSDCGSIREEEIPAIIEWDAVNVDLDVHVHQKSESIAEEFGAASLKLPRQPDADNASMHDIESIRNFVMEEEPSSAPEIMAVREMEVLPTIAERSEITTSRTSTLREEDQQEESLALVLDEHALSQMASTENSLNPKGSMDLRSPTIRETDIISDESLTTDLNHLEEHEERIDIYIELMHKRSPCARHILAMVAPEQRQAMIAALGERADTFDIVIEQEPEAAGFTVRVHDEIVDYSSLYVLAPDMDDQRGKHNKTPVGRPQSFHRLSQLSITSSNPQLVTPSMLDLDEITEYSSDEGDATARVKTGVNVSIIARSMHDMVYASLEEIPWGEVVLALPPAIPGAMMRSGDSASLQFNVTVSESYAEEKRSLHSSISEKLGSRESLNIPSYSIKVGSTATITCELNNYLPKDAEIEWFRGKTPVHRSPGKVDRISHDLLEVLVISHVTMDEGDLYSLSVNGELFPVAYLVIEEADLEEVEEEPLLILTPPQTLFVMDGQKAILSVQVVDPRIHVHWFKERKPLVESERIRFEELSDGSRTVVIGQAELTDQGTYYAYVDEQMTSVTLVVEERIREREVHVPPSGTEESEDDSEMLREYLVPPGCTATIACELESSEEKRELVWLRDDREIPFGDNQKIEHVRNGLKHYLVIHDTDPDDGGVYSVVISGVRFNVAHLAVNDLQTSIQKACRKRISNNSLH
ncbi:hypothetical protein PENTCL1PPCAC_1872, partial [Pristionchus entomophagus]